MSGRKKEKKSFNTYLIPGFFLAVIIISILSSFGVRMISDAKDQVEDDYQKEVKEITHIYEREIYAVDKATDILAAEMFTNQEELITDENIEKAKIVAETMGIKNIYFVNRNYSGADINGVIYSKINENEKFASFFGTKSNSRRFYSDGSGGHVMMMMKPIATKTILKGYIIVEYLPNIMETLLDNPKYSSRKTFLFVSADGDVIESAGADTVLSKVGGNVVDDAQKLMYVDGSYNSFRQAVHDCRTGSLQVIYQEIGKYIYYGPVEGSKASIIMLVDATDVERSFNAVSKSIRSMLLEIGVTIVAFVAIFAGISLFNKAKYNLESEDLQNKADTDLLTDLYNKIATERMIKEYLSGEGKNSVSMLFVLDVDNFKKINDTMGHAFGDQVLSQLGHQIRAWFRVNDIVGRIGGDEFMVFIKDVKDPEVIKREGSRIMQFFEGFSVGEYTRYSPTASVGGAVYPNDANDFESLYKAADKAVYKSKKEGKNKVSFYGDLNVIEKDAEIDKNKED